MKPERLAVFTLVAAVACGGAVTLDDQDGAGGRGGAGLSGSGGRGGAGSGSGGAAASAGAGRAGADAGPDVYVDPVCPAPPPRQSYLECDPFAAESGCRFDEGCYPFVQYPSGDPCGTEEYGTLCMPAGAGKQGDDCEAQRCASGFVCVIGGVAGSRCVQLCSVFGDDGCPGGMICEAIDIEQGYGGCI